MHEEKLFFQQSAQKQENIFADDPFSNAPALPSAPTLPSAPALDGAFRVPPQPVRERSQENLVAPNSAVTAMRRGHRRIMSDTPALRMPESQR